MSNSIYTSSISLYTPLKIHIQENTHLPLTLFFLFLSSSSSSLCTPTPSSSSEVAPNTEKHSENGLKWLLTLKNIVRMALKNSEKGVEISFKTVEKEDEDIQVPFFFRRMYLIRIRKSRYHNILRILKSGIYSTTGFNKSGL